MRFAVAWIISEVQSIKLAVGLIIKEVGYFKLAVGLIIKEVDYFKLVVPYFIGEVGFFELFLHYFIVEVGFFADSGDENAKSEAFFREFITSSHPKGLILGKPHFQLKIKQNDNV